MIAKIRKLLYLPTSYSLFYLVRKNLSFGPLCRLARAWWRGMLPCGKAMREEIETLEQIRDRWRSR